MATPVWRDAPYYASFGGARILPCFIARYDLIDVFQTEQHLLLRQRVCAAAKAMALQFLDDLTQPLALAPLGKQRRFQYLGIIRQGITRHQPIRP